MNRVMGIELPLPALLPGALIALHYAAQIFRPRFGYGPDPGGNGRGIALAGDASGVAAPASGEGIYDAMLGGRRTPVSRKGHTGKAET